MKIFLSTTRPGKKRFFSKLTVTLLAFLFLFSPFSSVVASDTTTVTIYPSKFYNTDGITSTKHIFANGGEVGTVTGTGSEAVPRYVHTDQLTGSNIVTNSADTKDETLDYFPFGSIRVDTGLYNNQRKFIGQMFDADTGLNYLNARYYDSNIGRFISKDSAFWKLPEEVLIDPQQQNCYSYARNNPTNLSDPSGKITIAAVKQTLNNSANFVFSRLAQSIRPQVIMPTLDKSIPRMNMDMTKTGNYNEKFASIEEELVGKQYLWGGNGPNSVDCSGAIIYGIRQSVDPNFGDHAASALFRNYSIPSDGTGIGTVIFYDYNSDHKIDHVTTYVGNSLIVQPSSGTGRVLLKAINYLDKYTLNQGGKIYYRQLDWQKIISGK